MFDCCCNRYWWFERRSHSTAANRTRHETTNSSYPLHKVAAWNRNTASTRSWFEGTERDILRNIQVVRRSDSKRNPWIPTERRPPEWSRTAFVCLPNQIVETQQLDLRWSCSTQLFRGIRRCRGNRPWTPANSHYRQAMNEQIARSMSNHLPNREVGTEVFHQSDLRNSMY